MDQPPPTYDELLDLVRRQARIIDELRAEVERLKAELEKSRRAGKRQAAPFSKGDPAPHPKRPGRKPGHPPAHRGIPAPEHVDRAVDVPLPGSCPDCRASLDVADVTIRDQYQVDLPPPRPLITRFRVPVARCPACSRRVQGRHPEQTSDALGAAAVQLGPRLLGLAADLKHRLGMPFRKCADVLGTLTGLAFAPSALARGSRRMARLARPSYDALIGAARLSDVQHADETGWRIGGRSAWLWVLADAHATVYKIRASRGHEVVLEVLGEDFPGVLVSDCFPAYDPLDYTKSKCAAHLLRRCSDVVRGKTRGAVRFGRRVAALLRAAMALKRRRGIMSAHGYAVLRGRLHAEWGRLLSGNYTDPDNARLARLLRKQREAVLAFLDHDEVDATNNLAEREIRPAVIARKVSAGNRSEAGAEAHAILASVLRTLCRQGRPTLEALAGLLRQGAGHVLDFDHITAGPAPAL